MKKNWLVLKAASIVLATFTGLAQGTFQNLNFESANPIPFGNSYTVATSNGLPAWVSYYDGEPTITIAYDTFSLGDAAVSLHDSASTLGPPIQGNYSVFLQGSGAGPARSAAIGQTGQLPVGAASIRFWASPLSNMQVTIDGQLIPLYALGAGPGYNILGGNIAAFAGQTHDLRFVGPANGGGFFDNIFFSNQPVPEPSVVALAGLAGLLWTGWWFRKR